jgi:hypothetical protein
LVTLELKQTLHIFVSLYACFSFCFCNSCLVGVINVAIAMTRIEEVRFWDCGDHYDRFYILVANLYRFTDLLRLFARANVVT